MADLNVAKPHEPFYSTYLNLGGGLNTHKDTHALDMNQLAASINSWYAYGDLLSKRPGSTAFVTNTGATGSGFNGKGITAGRFNDLSYVVVQQGKVGAQQLWEAKANDVSYTQIGTLNTAALPIHGAQMYDPETSADTLFLADGVDTPQTWIGPGNMIAAANVTAGHLPVNFGGANPITPKFVATVGNNSHLFYAGEPTYPTAVYISDPFFPQKFTSSASLGPTYPGTYQPYVVGLNDGIDGGDITGLSSLGSMMLVYKEAAIYRMIQVGLYGQMLWKSEIVSASVGCLSPRSIAAFDTFHVFLGIDGVYMTDGLSVKCISANVPTYFDSTLSGNAAIIVNRTTAVGGRQGNRYLIFFDDGLAGTPSHGLWFDFNKVDADGLPCVGEIAGMQVGGMVTLRNSGDDGNFVWTDAAVDRNGKFGLGFSDFGNPITLTFFGKADMFESLSRDAPMKIKVVSDVTLLVSLPLAAQGESVTFICTIVSDLLNASTTAASPTALTPPATGQWGENWGTMIWTSGTPANQFQIAKVYAQSTKYTFGRVVQVGFQESSIYPVNILGYSVHLNLQEISQ